MDKFIGATNYFNAYKAFKDDTYNDDYIKLTDLNGNYTILFKEDAKELIALLQKGLEELG